MNNCDYIRVVLINKHAGWIAYFIGTLIGIILAILFQSWIVLLGAAMVSGFFTTDYRKAIFYGSISIFTVVTVFVSFNLVFNQYLQLIGTFLEIYGVKEIKFYLLLFIDLSALLIGGTGGYFGATLRNFVQH